MDRPLPSSYRLEFLDAETNVRIVKFVTTKQEVDQFAQQGYAFEEVALYESAQTDGFAHNSALEQAALLCETLAEQATADSSDTVSASMLRAAGRIRALKRSAGAISH